MMADLAILLAAIFKALALSGKFSFLSIYYTFKCNLNRKTLSYTIYGINPWVVLLNEVQIKWGNLCKCKQTHNAITAYG